MAFYQAEQYNQVIASEYYSADNTEYENVLKNYWQILNVNDGIMGYIDIPSIKVRLPIYHGESEDVLKKGAAHLEQTSFPIGGTDTHACISAHSGYPSQKFFDDIDELEVGDLIYIKILNRVITYRVYGSEVITPDNTDKLSVEKGKEQLTLITCYPYGINSHRLLVNAERIDLSSEQATTADEIKVHTDSKRSLYMPVIGLVVSAIAIIILVSILLRFKKKNARR